FQKVLGHDLRPMSLRGSTSRRLRGEGSSAPCPHHFCGVDTATSMVTTSLPRLTISRLSFGPLKQASLALSTDYLPPAVSVSSPASTKETFSVGGASGPAPPPGRKWERPTVNCFGPPASRPNRRSEE